MDAKITLSFDEDIIVKAKKFASENNISLSRLTEFLYSKMTSKNYESLENLPISDWVNLISEGEVEYITKNKSRKDSRKEYFNSKK
jgi:hypothetical protein